MRAQKFAELVVSSRDVVVVVGGGMFNDVAGFAAASVRRGRPVVHVATSLVGMVDASVGGKTGVNIESGKNLVGAFWQPLGVICDLDALKTLPPREMRCGLGDGVKSPFFTGHDLPESELSCLLYSYDPDDEKKDVDLGSRRLHKKKK